MIRRVDWSVHRHVRTGDELTFGERSADAAVRAMGSWIFIIGQTVFIVAWITLNAVSWFAHWDDRPWVMLNLAFSVQAAFAAPLILLAARRQNQRADEMQRDDLTADQASLALLRKIAVHLNIDTAV